MDSEDFFFVFWLIFCGYPACALSCASELLHQSLQTPDDGTATFLLNAGRDILRILEEPFQTQVRLRNILEVTFDGMERASQQERFEKLRKTYPHVAQYCDPALLAGVPEG